MKSVPLLGPGQYQAKYLFVRETKRLCVFVCVSVRKETERGKKDSLPLVLPIETRQRAQLL